MNKFLIVAAVSTLAASPALAAEDAKGFSGFRAEARVGADDIKVSVDGESGSKSGVGYGLELGYDHDFGSGVVGVYGGVDLSDVKQCSEIFGLDEGCIKAGRTFTLGVRGGVKASDSALIYAKAGYVNGKVKVTYDDFEDILEDFSVSDTSGGFQLGAGAELTVSGGLYVKAEYLYSDFGDGFSRNQVMGGVGIRF